MSDTRKLVLDALNNSKANKYRLNILSIDAIVFDLQMYCGALEGFTAEEIKPFVIEWKKEQSKAVASEEKMNDEIICCPICGDTVEESEAIKGEQKIRADERQHFVEQACAAIADNPHKNPIEAITDMIRKESQSPP